MPQVLTTSAIITCPHGGVGTTTPAHPRASVSGGIVLVENDVGVLSCVALPPCVGYTLRSMGLNATKIDGLAVILVTDFNQTLTGLPLTMTETHSCVDDSTPAPIPPGAAPPPLTPEMADVAAPVVAGVITSPTFVTAQSLPPAVTATFTLASAFPNRWVLTRLSETTGTHGDLTSGDPGGAVVAPAGGAWDAPALTVTLALSATYMAALGPGPHHFYMTGVSKRGLSAYAKVTLTVS